jgi:hypothetical protein
MPVDFDATVNAAAMAAFGQAATYAPKDSDAFALNGDFRSSHSEVTVSEGAPVSTTVPVMFVRLADFPAGISPAQNDTLMVNGVEYRVADIEPDAIGGAKLLLMLAADEQP